MFGLLGLISAGALLTPIVWLIYGGSLANAVRQAGSDLSFIAILVAWVAAGLTFARWLKGRFGKVSEAAPSPEEVATGAPGFFYVVLAVGTAIALVVGVRLVNGMFGPV